MRTRRRCASSSLPSFSKYCRRSRSSVSIDLDGPLDDLVAGDVVGGGVDGDVLELVAHLARHHVEGHDALDGVAEHLDPQRLLLVGRMDLDRVAPGPERPPDEVDVVAGVLQIDELAQDVALVVLLADGEPENAVPVLDRRAQAVDARDRGHHDDVPAHEQRRGGGVAQAVDLVVDRRVLLYVGVGRREVGLGLVVVVVRDEELDPVLGEQVPQLGAELGRQGLVRLDDESGALDLFDHPGDRGRLPGAGDALEGLVPVPSLRSLDERGDGSGLVAGGFEGGDDLEIGHEGRIPGGCIRGGWGVGGRTGGGWGR